MKKIMLVFVLTVLLAVSVLPVQAAAAPVAEPAAPVQAFIEAVNNNLDTATAKKSFAEADQMWISLFEEALKTVVAKNEMSFQFVDMKYEVKDQTAEKATVLTSGKIVIKKGVYTMDYQASFPVEMNAKDGVWTISRKNLNWAVPLIKEKLESKNMNLW